MASATGTVITKKIFRSHKLYILSRKVFKVTLLSRATLNTYQHALKSSLTSAKLPSPEMSFELECCGVANFSTLDPLRNCLTDSGSNPVPKFSTTLRSEIFQYKNSLRQKILFNQSTTLTDNLILYPLTPALIKILTLHLDKLQVTGFKKI